MPVAAMLRRAALPAGAAGAGVFAWYVGYDRTAAAAQTLFPRLERIGGRRVMPEIELKGKKVVLYFGADWCPDCRDFNKTLKKAHDYCGVYDQVKIVYIPSDKSVDEVTNAMIHQGGQAWCTVPFDSRQEYKKRYQICAGSEMAELGIKTRRAGIPGMVAVDPSGAELNPPMDGPEFMEKQWRSNCMGMKGWPTWYPRDPMVNEMTGTGRPSFSRP